MREEGKQREDTEERGGKDGEDLDLPNISSKLTPMLRSTVGRQALSDSPAILIVFFLIQPTGSNTF